MADQINSVTGGGGGFSLDFFTDTLVRFNVPTSGSFDVLYGDDYIVTSSQPDGTFDRTLSNIQIAFPNSPATINFLFPSTGIQEPPYTATFTVSWADPTPPPPDLSSYVTSTELNTLISQIDTSVSVSVTNQEPDESFPDGTLIGSSSGRSISINRTPAYHIHQDDDFLTAWQDIATAMTELAAISTTLKGYTESIKNDISVFKTLGTNPNQGISTKGVFVNAECTGGGLQPAIVIEALQDAGIWEDVLKQLGDPVYMPSGKRQSEKDAGNA